MSLKLRNSSLIKCNLGLAAVALLVISGQALAGETAQSSGTAGDINQISATHASTNTGGTSLQLTFQLGPQWISKSPEQPICGSFNADGSISTSTGAIARLECGELPSFQENTKLTQSILTAKPVHQRRFGFHTLYGITHCFPEDKAGDAVGLIGLHVGMNACFKYLNVPKGYGFHNPGGGPTYCYAETPDHEPIGGPGEQRNPSLCYQSLKAAPTFGYAAPDGATECYEFTPGGLPIGSVLEHEGSSRRDE